MIEDTKKDVQARMEKTIAAFEVELSRVRTGRAHPSLLEQVMVEYYGSEVPVSQVANVSVEDARTLVVAPWEQSMVGKVEKAIINSDLGLNPSTAGTSIRVPLPPLTEERRKALAKVCRGEAENARVAIRNIRRDGINTLKAAQKDKLITEDDERRGGDELQKVTDKFVATVDEMLAKKETDLMEV
ncbi:MAG: ribosome recycling factor [Gammaproteobacteria bacterium]|nr:ribosome recycling factor [Gammaproteobacteria bacterium]